MNNSNKIRDEGAERYWEWAWGPTKYALSVKAAYIAGWNECAEYLRQQSIDAEKDLANGNHAALKGIERVK